MNSEYKEKRDNRIVDLMFAMKASYKKLGFEPSTKAMTIELAELPSVKISAKTIAAIVRNSGRWEAVKWVKPKESEVIPVAITKPANYIKYHTCAWS